jgi:hypothetical protein
LRSSSSAAAPEKGLHLPLPSVFTPSVEQPGSLHERDAREEEEEEEEAAEEEEASETATCGGTIPGDECSRGQKRLERWAYACPCCQAVTEGLVPENTQRRGREPSLSGRPAGGSRRRRGGGQGRAAGGVGGGGSIAAFAFARFLVGGGDASASFSSPSSLASIFIGEPR